MVSFNVALRWQLAEIMMNKNGKIFEMNRVK